MRNLEDIEKDLAAAREALASVEGTPAEVYSRIVGYYRSVRNWNRGKREEYGERRLFTVPEGAPGVKTSGEGGTERLLLFVRPSCPACPAAKAAAGQLGIPVDLVDADTDEGLSEARRRNVMSTPTAILLNQDGAELGRALDGPSITAFGTAFGPLTLSKGDEIPVEAAS
ncbi:MAG: anaerobic ribonucleoside-triphosphate reductase [Treponema sp.]|nr:anaerobic ribonucleoside-triphosphate reductase [Treponema sp.]